MENKLERLKTLLRFFCLLIGVAFVAFLFSNFTTLFLSYVNKKSDYVYKEGQGIDALIRNCPNDSGWKQIRMIAPHTIEDIDMADSLVLMAIELDDPEMKSYAYVTLGSLFATEGDFTKALELADNGREIARHGLNTLGGGINKSFYLYDLCYANRVMGYTYRLMTKDSDALAKFDEAGESQERLEKTAHNYWGRITNGTTANQKQNALLHSNCAYSYLARDTASGNDARECWLKLDTTTSMIRARYWHIKALLGERKLLHEGNKAIFESDAAQIMRDYNSCFIAAEERTDRRSRLTNIISHLSYSGFRLRMGDSSGAISAAGFAFDRANGKEDPDFARLFLQQAADAAEALKLLYSGTNQELYYADKVISAKKKMDSLQYKHMEVNMRLVERIREKEEWHEEKNDDVLLWFLAVIAFLYLVVAGCLIFARKKNPGHKNHKHWVGFATWAFVIIVELSGIVVHHKAGKLTQQILGVAAILVAVGLVFHAFEELLFHEEEKQAIHPVMIIQVIRTVITVIRRK